MVQYSKQFWSICTIQYGISFFSVFCILFKVFFFIYKIYETFVNWFCQCIWEKKTLIIVLGYSGTLRRENVESELKNVGYSRIGVWWFGFSRRKSYFNFLLNSMIPAQTLFHSKRLIWKSNVFASPSLDV